MSIKNIKASMCMDDEDGIAGRHAVIEHKEYLVDAVKRPVQIEVYVLSELTGRRHNSSPRAHFHRPYCTTVTHLAAKEDPDALFTLLRRCLPFREWDYVDTSTTYTYFDPYLYLLKPGEGTESEEDEAFHMHDYKERFYASSIDLEDSEPEQRMRAALSELTTRMFTQFWAHAETWWFVLKARQPPSRPPTPPVRQGFDWTALDPGLRAQIRRHAHARWRQEVVLECNWHAPWPVPYQLAQASDSLEVSKRFSFKRVPRSVMDTAPLLTVTFSLHVDRTQFNSEYEEPYNLSASEQDSLCAQVERTYCWTGVRQIRLIRFVTHQRWRTRDDVTDTNCHNFNVQLVLEDLEETADDGSQVSVIAITPPNECFIYYPQFVPHEAYSEPGDPMYEPAWRGLIHELTEELGLVHTTVPVLHRGHEFDDHVFSVQ